MSETEKIKKPKKIHNPTPYLGVPRSNRQLFTFSENKLLDQITTEICEAWSKDLLEIRKCHKETNENINHIKEANELFEEAHKKFKKIYSFMDEEGFFPKLDNVIERQQQMFLFMEEIRQSCFKTQEQILGFRKLIEELKNKVETHLKDKSKINPENPKKWWMFCKWK